VLGAGSLNDFLFTVRHWTPDYGCELGDIFKEAHSSIDPSPQPTCKPMSKSNLCLRKVYLTDIYESSPWRLYELCEAENRDFLENLYRIEFAQSFKFLLNSCSDILNIPVMEIFSTLFALEIRCGKAVQQVFTQKRKKRRV